MVYKAMDRRQVSLFKKMLGKPFDVDSLRAGFFRGGPGRNGPAAGGPRAKDASKTASGTTPATAAAKADASSGTTTKPATTPRRQSLRERRGLGASPGRPARQLIVRRHPLQGLNVLPSNRRQGMTLAFPVFSVRRIR